MENEKINDTKLIKLVDAGNSQAEIARFFGVSRQAVHKRFRELRGKATKVIVGKKVEKIVDEKIDGIQQLRKINRYANELLDSLMKGSNGDEEALRALGNEVRNPRELALRAMAEIRSQLQLELSISQTLYDLRAAQGFIQEVVDVIGEVDKDVRQRIIERLNRRRAVNAAVRFN